MFLLEGKCVLARHLRVNLLGQLKHALTMLTMHRYRNTLYIHFDLIELIELMAEGTWDLRSVGYGFKSLAGHVSIDGTYGRAGPG